MSTELVLTVVTTPEQTVLDLARRPDLGDAEGQVRDAVQILITRADLDYSMKSRPRSVPEPRCAARESGCARRTSDRRSVWP
jgi:hypothetical protein